MIGRYVMRWPVLDEEQTTDDLRAEAIPLLLEQLEKLQLKFVADTAAYRIIPGDPDYFEASVIVSGEPPTGSKHLTRLRTFEHFQIWHEHLANHPDNKSTEAAA